MEKIPTAKEMHEEINRNLDEALFTDREKWKDRDVVQEALIEFARLHVRAALEAAAENASAFMAGSWTEERPTINKSSVINAYSFENIK